MGIWVLSKLIGTVVKEIIVSCQACDTSLTSCLKKDWIHQFCLNWVVVKIICFVSHPWQCFYQSFFFLSWTYFIVTGISYTTQLIIIVTTIIRFIKLTTTFSFCKLAEVSYLAFVSLLGKIHLSLKQAKLGSYFWTPWKEWFFVLYCLVRILTVFTI